jgi:signal recognition particle GTPase
MDEVRNALLEADVQYEVAEGFCAKVLQDALGSRSPRASSPGRR